MSNNIKSFVISNVSILNKIPTYNHEISYILNQSKDDFDFCSPEIIYGFAIVIQKCLELEKNNIPPEEWLKTCFE